MYVVYFQQLTLCYLFENYELANVNASQVSLYLEAATGLQSYSLFYFYSTLTKLAIYATQTPTDREATQVQIDANIEKLAFWAHHAPMNYLHRLQLVKAENYRVAGLVLEAMEAYDLAIAGARENGYIQEEALANELAAKFYLAQKRITIAKAYMKEARYCYQKWGAKAKVDYLEANYQEILEGAISYKDSSKISLLRNSTSSSSGNLEAIDLESVMRSSHAIANEIDLDALLTTLMNILIENAGAQRGCLLLPENLSDLTEWRIEAIVTVDGDRAIGQSIPLDTISPDGGTYLPISLVDYVTRTRKTLVLNNAAQAENFQNDPWIVRHRSKSILCMPLLNQANLSAIVFLENNLATDVFTPRRIEILNLLSTQAAISIGKSRLLKQQEELNQSLQAEIYDRQLAERSRDRLTALIQASTDIIGMSSPQGKVIWNNAQANKFIGLPPDADPSDYAIPNYHPQWALDIILNEGIPYAIASGSWLGETAILTPDGIEIPISQMIIAHKSVDGELEYISTIMRDISEAKKREAELKRSEATLQSIVEGTAAVTGDDFFPALVKHIAEALQVKYALVTQLSGDRLQAIAFWAHGALQPPIVYFPAYTPCEIALRNGEYICESFVQQIFPEDADLVMMQADSYMGISLKDAEGNSIGNLCVLDIKPLQDIPRIRNILKVFAARASAELQRKAANDALYELNQTLEMRVQKRTIQLEAANKELESFSYSISHDLRAPLRAIDGFSRILQEDYRDRLDAEGNRYLKIVRENAKRMGELIDDLLNLSRLNRREMTRQSISVNKLVQKLLGNFESELASRQIEFVFADLPDCKGDRSLITQVWINLLSNAIKYTSKTESARIEIGCQETEDEKIYFVRDNGAGFDMQYADKLFGVFQRMHLERDFEGTGIGLAIAQRIVQRHGGRIWADAAVNLGATFYFTIPDQGPN
jgi:signal transduction histidine kinase/PAS domain-containing protein